MRIKIINKGKLFPTEISLIRNMLKEIMKQEGIRDYYYPAIPFQVTLQRGKSCWHGNGSLSQPRIRLCIPKPPYCAEELKFLVWHEYLHTLGLEHKEMSKESMTWPCACFRNKPRKIKPELKVKTHKVYSYYDNKDFIKRLRVYCAELPYQVEIRGGWADNLDIFIANEHAGKILRVCILLPKDPTYDDFLEIEDEIVNLQAETKEEKS